MTRVVLVAIVTVAVGACMARPAPPTDPAQMPAYVGATGTFSKPAGAGPFPVVVVMHGCGGPPGHFEWVKRLNEWGYAAYYIDSFTARNLKHVCAERQFRGVERVPDAYAALAHLRTRADVRGERIGLIGFSHGGAATTAVARADQAARAGIAPFAAAVAYYGGCSRQKFELATDLLILYGEADDWANVAACPRMAESQDPVTRKRLTVVGYPGAYHDFDVWPSRPRIFLGHHLEYNDAAAKDAFARTKAFFDARLR